MGNAPIQQVDNHVYPSGNIYSGQMRNKKRHGQGTLRWPDGAVYVGSWVMDKCEGPGVMKFPNGSVFEGNFVQHNPYGQGKLTTINQEVLYGFWNYLGRSGMTTTPVGKYEFNGELIDLKSGERRYMNGPLALYLQSGLVSLPNMPDPMQSLLPYAEVVAATAVANKTGGKTDKYEAETGVPLAHAIQTAPTSSNSIAYGQADAAFFQRHPDDHAAISLLDPRTHLAALGVPVTPANVNAHRQAEIQSEYQVPQQRQ
jgi:hypothetical protein